MSSTMSQSVQYIIDANAPMVFTYAHSRPEVQRIVYPTRIRGDTVSTIDAETGKYKKFKLDGIIFPQPEPSIKEYLSYAIDEGLSSQRTVSQFSLELKLIFLIEDGQIKFQAMLSTSISKSMQWNIYNLNITLKNYPSFALLYLNNTFNLNLNGWLMIENGFKK
jgi:hypothetical protein